MGSLPPKGNDQPRQEFGEEKPERICTSDTGQDEGGVGVGEEPAKVKAGWARVSSIALSVACAGLFLYLAFRNIGVNAVLTQLGRVRPGNTLGLIGLTVFGVAARGWRWWYLLPRPLRGYEFWPCQRAMAIGYALNNLAPRLGEVTRVVLLGRTTKRPFGVIAGTLVLDRLLLDLLAVVALFSFGMVMSRQTLTATFPHQVGYFDSLLLLSVAVLAALSFFAASPRSLVRLLRLAGLNHWPKLWDSLSKIVAQLAMGMEVLTKPGRYIMILFQSILIWGSYLFAFHVGLQAFGISLGPGPLVAAFSITTLGMLAPSPGGVGTFHFFAQASLVALSDVQPLTAAAFATYLHGVNYVSLSGLGVFAFLYQRRSERQRPKTPEEKIEGESSGGFSSEDAIPGSRLSG